MSILFTSLVKRWGRIISKPLAFLLRPTSIDEIIGQKHLINNENGIIARMISQKFVTSLIFYGNPGIGKTTIALLLANHLKINYDVFNAAIDKKSTLEQIIVKASKHQQYIIIVEEIHRMNKDKQDLLLQYLEHGNLIMFACTTENLFLLLIRQLEVEQISFV